MTRLPPPQEQVRVIVTAARFSWQFTYPDSKVTSYTLNLPINRPAVLYMQSKDVVHAFWVQEFGPKQDIVPGITTVMLITPTKIGDYIVQCSQLCGTGHTFMLAAVKVTSDADFQAWLEQQAQAQHQ
jgi:cytochrome c oxidase subunit 2